MKKENRRRYKEILNNPDKKWIITYPRSGTHWTSAVLCKYAEQPRFGHLGNLNYTFEGKEFLYYHTHDLSLRDGLTNTSRRSQKQMKTTDKFFLVYRKDFLRAIFSYGYASKNHLNNDFLLRQATLSKNHFKKWFRKAEDLISYEELKESHENWYKILDYLELEINEERLLKILKEETKEKTIQEAQEYIGEGYKFMNKNMLTDKYEQDWQNWKKLKGDLVKNAFKKDNPYFNKFIYSNI